MRANIAPSRKKAQCNPHHDNKFGGSALWNQSTNEIQYQSTIPYFPVDQIPYLSIAYPPLGTPDEADGFMGLRTPLKPTLSATIISPPPSPWCLSPQSASASLSADKTNNNVSYQCIMSRRVSITDITNRAADIQPQLVPEDAVKHRPHSFQPCSGSKCAETRAQPYHPENALLSPATHSEPTRYYRCQVSFLPLTRLQLSFLPSAQSPTTIGKDRFAKQALRVRPKC